MLAESQDQANDQAPRPLLCLEFHIGLQIPLLTMLPNLGDTGRAQIGSLVLAGLDLTHPHGLNHECTFHTVNPRT